MTVQHRRGRRRRPPAQVGGSGPGRPRLGGRARAVRRRAVAPLVALVVLAAATTGGGPTVAADHHHLIDDPATCCAVAVRTSSGERSLDAVAIIGDSLTVGVTSPAFVAETLQSRLLAQGRPVTLVSARVGRPLREGIEVVEARRAEVGAADVVLVALGTNDLWGSVASSDERAAAAIAELRDAVRAVDPTTVVVWVDVAAMPVPGRAATFNRALATTAALDDRFEVCRWSEGALARPATFASDGIHLTGEGYRHRRDVMLDCLRDDQEIR